MAFPTVQLTTLIAAIQLAVIVPVSAQQTAAATQGNVGETDSGDLSENEQSNSGENDKADLITRLAERLKKSVVMVHATGRDGKDFGHGTGFVISTDGLIATCRHVIGDRRAIRIDMPDGTSAAVTHIHSMAEAVDVVVLKVDAKNLSPLPLGEAAAVKAGQAVVAVGHPGATKNSVFSGIVSGRHDIEGISTLQLAMTIEPGSSGEPVVDMQGKVLGVVSMKSNLSPNVGFAIPVNHLRILLEDPTPIPMSRWMTIGALDPQRWEMLFGDSWRQRASRITVDGNQTGFGQRSLCLLRDELPEIPYEVQVDVKLANEKGAAGLVFHADGKHRHYGFYPSNGELRFTRFDGPTVYQWNVLHREPHSAYRPNEWNTWNVRIEADRMLCRLNGEQVFETSDNVIPPGRPGLATYRGTTAEFRRFRIGSTIASDSPSPGEAAMMRDIVSEVASNRPASGDVVKRMQPHVQYASRYLEDEARKLEARARQIRQLAIDVHAARTTQEIVASVTPPADANAENFEPDLLRAALLIAVLDNDEIEVKTYVNRVDQLATEVKESLPKAATEVDRLHALDKLLFDEYGFRGSRDEYYTRSNSYLNEVIDDREGLPITLSVLYMELGRRLGLNIVGLGLPGHYVVRFEPSGEGEEPQIIDVFSRGKRLSNKEAEQIVRDHRFPVRPEFFEAQPALMIVRRMLSNLLGLAEANRDSERVLRYLEVMVALDNESLDYRLMRMEIRGRTGRVAEALTDAEWILERLPNETAKDQFYEFRAELQRQLDLQQAKQD